MAMGKLSGKTRIEGVDTPGLVVEAHERDDRGRYSVIHRTVSGVGGVWIIPGLDADKLYDVVMRAPTKPAVISDTRKPTLEESSPDPFYAKVVLQTSFDNLEFDDFGHPIVKAGTPTIINDAVRGNVLNIPSANGHAIKFDVVDGGKLDMAGDDFTIEMWVNVTGGTSAIGYPFSLGGGLDYSWHAVTLGLSPNSRNGNWAIRSRPAELANLNPDINYYRTWIDSTSPNPFIGRWVHIAVTRKEDAFRFFINGVLIDSVNRSNTSTAWYPLMKYSNLSGISIGAPFWSAAGTPAEGLACKIDDLRITRACRYTANFTPPQNLNTFA